MTSSKPLELPLIDLFEAKASPEGRKRNEKALYDALTDTGFFYITGLDGYDSEELLRLTKWFFNLPLEAKMNVSKTAFVKDAKNSYRGYFPVIPGELSHKEAFELGSGSRKSSTVEKWEKMLYEDNPWPEGEENLGVTPRIFKERMEFYFEMHTNAAFELIKLIDEAWGHGKEYLAPLFSPQPLSTFRLLHYPHRAKEDLKEAVLGNYVIVTPEHRDTSMITLLSTFDNGGLQILTTDNEWVDVPNKPNCLVVNIGALLSGISGGILKATNHRIYDIGTDRYSLPFFFEPDYQAVVGFQMPPPASMAHPQVREHDESLPEPGVKYGVWSVNRFKQFAEYRQFFKEISAA